MQRKEESVAGEKLRVETQNEAKATPDLVHSRTEGCAENGDVSVASMATVHVSVYRG